LIFLCDGFSEERNEIPLKKSPDYFISSRRLPTLSDCPGEACGAHGRFDDGDAVVLSLFGHNVRSEMVLLYVSEAMACFLAIYTLSVFDTRPSIEAQHGFVAFAVILALSSGPISGAGGLYQAERWWQPGRLLAGAAVSGVLLLGPATIALVFDDVMPGFSFWPSLPRALLGAMVAITITRLAFMAASQRNLFTRRIAVLRDATGITPSRSP
jgi:hypothetical protein